MTRTLDQIDRLVELRKKVEDSDLGRYYYQNSSGCRCVVGHMANEAGVLDELTGKYNSEPVEEIVEHYNKGLVDTILSHYGLDFGELESLQLTNDHHNENKVAVLYKIDEYIIGGI